MKHTKDCRAGKSYYGLCGERFRLHMSAWQSIDHFYWANYEGPASQSTCKECLTRVKQVAEAELEF